MCLLRKQILKTMTGFVEAFNSNTAEGTIAYRSAICRHHVIPSSPYFPTRSNKEYQSLMVPFFKIAQDFHLRLLEGVDPIIDTEVRRAVLHLTSTAETPLGEYKNQYVFTFKLNADGTEIDEIVEFVDMVVLNEMMPKFMALGQEQAGAMQ